MASNYPTSLDSFNNPQGTDSLNSPSHSLQHSDINDAVEAIEAKLGIGASPAGSATAGQVLTAQGGGTVIWATPALVHLNTTTFSAVASQSVNDVFSADYDNYLVITNLTASTNLTLNIRLRASGSDYSTNDQWLSIIYNTWVGSTLADAGTTKTSSQLFTFGLDTSRHQNTFNLYEPFLTTRTRASGTWTDDTDTGIMNARAGNTNSYTGLSWIASTGTITGTISIYGYRKS